MKICEKELFRSVVFLKGLRYTIKNVLGLLPYGNRGCYVEVFCKLETNGGRIHGIL